MVSSVTFRRTELARNASRFSDVHVHLIEAEATVAFNSDISTVPPSKYRVRCTVQFKCMSFSTKQCKDSINAYSNIPP